MTTSRTLVLSFYSLTPGARAQVESRFGAAVYLTVAELRRMPLREMLDRLRRERQDAVIGYLDDPSVLAIAPMLQILLAAVRARKRYLLDWTNSSRAFSLPQVIPGILGVAWATLAGYLAMARNVLALRRLLDKPRLVLKDNKRDSILYLNANAWFGLKVGGSVGHVAGVINGLEETGHRVNLFSVSETPMIRPTVRRSAIELPRFMGMPLEINLQRFNRIIATDVAGRASPDQRFIYQRLSLSNFSGARLSRRLRLPLIVEYNGSEVWAAKHWGTALRYGRAATWAEDAMLRHAHMVVTISDPLKDELIARGVEPERIICYPNCIDPSHFDPDRFSENEILELRHRLGFAADDNIATFVGTFGAWHGADVFAEAIRMLRESQPEELQRLKLKFLFVGDGMRAPAVKEMLSGPQYADLVHFSGLVPQNEAARYLAASDIFMSPHVPNPDGTRFFGSPTKLFEYMAMSKGIVASDLDQIGEVLRPAIFAKSLPEAPPAGNNRELALLCTPGSAKELAEGLLFLARDRSWSAALGRNARKTALERYTWKEHVGAIIARFEKLSAERGVL